MIQELLQAHAVTIIVGGIGLAFTVGTVFATVKYSLRDVSKDLNSLRSDMRTKDEVHDNQLNQLDTRVRVLEKKTAVHESVMSNGFKHVAEQIDRIYQKLFKD